MYAVFNGMESESLSHFCVMEAKLFLPVVWHGEIITCLALMYVIFVLLGCERGKSGCRDMVNKC